MDEKYSILIIEDEDSLRLNIKNFLTNTGFEVHVASEGLGAIHKLIDFKIDLIISDYRMDIFGGNYWVKFLKKFCSDTKVLFISGFLNPNEEFPYTVIYKPFDLDDLLKHIKTVLNIS
ncbi:MAG: response regulator [Spirochaetes bacterium]|nr:response regulator [Spirochaetota bacterium]